MRWTRGERSENLEDRRGEGRGGGLVPGRFRLGCGGFILLAVLSLVFRKNFFALLDPGMGSASVGAGVPHAPAQTTAEEEERADFVSFVLDDVQKTWRQKFVAGRGEYRDAKLVLFRNSINSACGFANAASGPFYCPGDEKVYIDLGFYDELRSRFGAPGDFAQAYVIAHEIGHHIQNVLGIEQKVRQQQRMRPDLENELSIRMELQADCLAGIWAHSTAERDLLEKGDVEEGLGAAAAVGDDRIQKQASGHVNPESWTHGSSDQRMAWFSKGYSTGEIRDCDTFGGTRKR